MLMMDAHPDLPIPISMVNDKYLIFDINAISFLRREHHICGVMAGTLPQNPSQNMFLGLPMQLMPEEAQLLLENGVGCIRDDPRAHDQAMRKFDRDRYSAYMSNIRRKAQQASKIRTAFKEESKKMGLSKRKGKKADASQSDGGDDLSQTPQSESFPSHDLGEAKQPFVAARLPLFNPISAKDDSSIDPFASIVSKTNPPETEDLPLITPTTTSADFLSPSQTPAQIPKLSNLPLSYPLYKHLNTKSYFTTPGLRFGCQYCVYPGDPLRFHSHFLAVGYEWEDEIDLMDIVGGGRLGTGVKKGWLLGGLEPASSEGGNPTTNEARVRTFSVEWAAM